MQNHELASRLETFQNSPELQANDIPSLLGQLIQILQVPPGEEDQALDISNQLRHELKKKPANTTYFELALFLARYWSRNERDHDSLKPIDSIFLEELNVDDTTNVLALSNGRLYDKSALVEHFKHVGGYSAIGEPQDDVNRELLSLLDIRHLEANGIVFLEPAAARRGRQDFIMNANLDILREATGITLTAPEMTGILSGGLIGTLVGTVTLFALLAFSPILLPSTLGIVLAGSTLAGVVNLWRNWQEGERTISRIAHFGQGFLLSYAAQLLTLSLASLAASVIIGLMGVIPAIPVATIVTATAFVNLIQPWIPATLVAVTAISHALKLQTMNLIFGSIVIAPVLLAARLFASIGFGVVRMFHGTAQRPAANPGAGGNASPANNHRGIHARLVHARGPGIRAENELETVRQHHAVAGALSPASRVRMSVWNNASESQVGRGHEAESPRLRIV